MGSSWGSEEPNDWSDMDEDEVPLSAGTLGRDPRTVLRKRQTSQVQQTSSSNVNYPSVRCRGTLHTEPKLAVLNTPVYIATDSMRPLKDKNLKLFFDTFPCSYVLSDLTEVTAVNRVPVTSFRKLGTLTSAEDGLKLDRFLYPLLEAVIAAKVRSPASPPYTAFEL